jgi:hypothetical protein
MRDTEGFVLLGLRKGTKKVRRPRRIRPDRLAQEVDGAQLGRLSTISQSPSLMKPGHFGDRAFVFKARRQSPGETGGADA